MSLDAEVRPLLLTACPRAYRGRVRVTPVYPLIIYQKVGGRAFDYSEQKVPGKANARLQVWVWAKSPLEADAISRAVRVALVEGPTKARTLIDPVDDENEALDLFGSRADYEVWYTP